jgi:uncharacterized protein YndB with AHSA1/START domain
MNRIESIGPYLEPLRKSVTVRRTPAEAFEIFTNGFSGWWPTRQFSIHLEETATCGIEPRIGGEIFEVSNAGRREVWGTVIVWEPPHRIAMTWHPGRDPSSAQEVELRFVAVPEGTRVELEHRGWTKLGERAKEARTSYEEGWVMVFERCYVEACT